MNYSAIPADMVRLPNWVARQGKIPYGINGERAKVNTPRTWSTLQKVKSFLNGAPPAYNGLGFMLERKNKIVCVDVDRCLVDGKPNCTATKVLEKIDTYTETSQSGTGLHFFGRGTMPKSSVKFKSPFDVGTDIEIYAGLDDKNKCGRFIAFTGDVYEGHKTLRDIQGGIDWLLSMAPAGKATAPDDDHNISPPVAIKENTDDTITVSGVTYTADDIPALIEERQTGTKEFTWYNLFHKGDLTAYDGDRSRADSALCSILCFWCHGKPALIDKVFRNSKLMREKWDRKTQGAKTYGALTIENALKVWNGKKYKGNSPAFPHLTSKGTPLRNHSENFKALIAWLDDDVTIRYNQLKHRQEITINGKCWAVDHGITLLLDSCAKYGLITSTSRVGEWVALLAEENAYSPVVDYLQDCYIKYKQLSDIYSPVDTLWKTLHLSATAQENEPFLKKLFIKWLVGCVAIAHNDNESRIALQGVLVLKGGQGIGKTTFARKLLPAAGSDWFIEGLSINTKDKDSVMLATTFWIVELGEFSETFRKSSFDELKQFLTKTRDDVRIPYAKNAKPEPRRTAYIATVNDDTFLADKTGNRRYWVLDLDFIDLDTPIDVNLLWGAVMVLWKDDKVSYGLTLEEIKQLGKINTHYERATDMEQVLIDSLDWASDTTKWQWITPTALCTLLEVPSTQARKMGRALTVLANNSEYEGIKKKRTNKAMVYLLPPVSLSTCDNASEDFDVLADEKEQ